MAQEEYATIMLVEDNPLTLRILIEHLKRLGHQTTIARSAEEALRQIGLQKPDLILLDILLPGIDGFEACRRLKGNSATKDIPVIFLTVLSQTEDKVKAFEVGGVDFLTKPVDFKEVSARIHTRLSIQKLQRRLKTRRNMISSGLAPHQDRKSVIMVVEDNPMALQLLEKYLGGMGFSAVGTSSGEEALEMLKSTIPDIILLDVMLPGIDGFETCRLFKKSLQTRDVPVIFMTALSDTHDKVRAFEAGAVDYITKPHHYAEIVTRINTHLTLKALRRQLKNA